MANEANYNKTMKILEQTHISPPPGSVPPTKLPLTLFDISWLMRFPQQIFFFQVPQPTPTLFTHTIIPNLKHSLSLTLHHFFPLAADLILPPPPHKPYLLFGENSFVSLTVAESSDDFNRLVSNHVRDVKELHPFVPELPRDVSEPLDGIPAPTYALPVFALQVTIFPNSGFSIGFTLNHVAADARSMTHFRESWASICNNILKNQKLIPIKVSLDRTKDSIKGPSELDSHIESFYTWALNNRCNRGNNVVNLQGKVRATFVMGRAHLKRLKDWASAHFAMNDETRALRSSSFVVVCAFMWAHLIKVQRIETVGSTKLRDSEKICYFVFTVDCRNRKGFMLPTSYFGNCLGACPVAMKWSELVGENGTFEAAKAIATKIKEIEAGVIFIGAEKLTAYWKIAHNMGNFLTVAGSPNIRVYETDFGWGRLKKCELVQIEVNGAFSIFDSREKEGGVEIGVVLNKDEMNSFSNLFELSLVRTRL